MVEQKTFPDRLPTGKHYRKEITILLQHGSLQVIQERERELYRALLQHNLHTSMLSDNFKPGIERYTSGGVVIR